MDNFDVAIIGAGPSGSMAAKYAAKTGASAIMLEEHPCVGWPVECAGLLGLKALQESELGDGNYLCNGLKGATIYSPRGSRIDFMARSWRAWVVNRRLFDRALALEALREGASIKLCSHVRKITREGKFNYLFLKNGKKIKARVVISAEGVRAKLAREAGIRPVQKILSGAQIEAPFRVEDPGKVEVYLGMGSGLFGWIIPTSDKTAEIGLCTTEGGCNYLQAFLRKDLISNRLLGSPVSLFVGGLPLGPSMNTVADGMLALGDAAGQVKPISGGGIYPGLICAKIAGIVAASAAQEGDNSAERLFEYDRRWRAVIGRELGIGLKVNQILNRMSADDIEEFVRYLGNKPRILRIIEEHGDIDRPSLLMTKMLPYLGLDGLWLLRLLRYILN